MKKIMFTACAAVVSVAVFTACGNGSSSASKVSEEKVNGTAYAITRTTNETGTVVFGVKNGEEQVIPNDYASMSYTHGYFLSGYDKMMAGVNLKGAALLDPQNGEEVITSDSISFNEEGGYFIGKGKQSGIALFYPENKVGFYALRDYVISGNIVLAKTYEGWGAYRNTAPNDTIIAPNDYAKIVLLDYGKKVEFLVPYEKGNWLKLDAKDEGVELLTAAQAGKLKGWQKDAEAFVIKK